MQRYSAGLSHHFAVICMLSKIKKKVLQIQIHNNCIVQRYSAGLSHHFAVIWSNARPAFLCHSFFFPSLFLAEQFLFSPFI